MPNYILSIDSKTKRIILDTENHGEQLEVISADHVMGKDKEGNDKIELNAWQIARDMINDLEFEYKPGHGYFIAEEILD